MEKSNKKIVSVREALDFVDVDFDSSNESDCITGAHVKCKGCGERDYFRSIYTIPSLLGFANRHRVCTEIKTKIEDAKQEYAEGNIS